MTKRKWTTKLPILLLIYVAALIIVSLSINVEAATVRVPGRVTGVTLTPIAKHYDSFYISWKKPVNWDKYTQYQVYVKHEGIGVDKYVKVGTFNYNTTKICYLANDKIREGMKTWVKIRAYNKKTKQYGAWSAGPYIITRPSRPNWITVTYNGKREDGWANDNYTIKWQEPVGYTEILLYCRYINPQTREKGPWTKIKTITEIGQNWYIWRPEWAGNYQFKVRAYNRLSKYLTSYSPASKEIGFS